MFTKKDVALSRAESVRRTLVGNWQASLRCDGEDGGGCEMICSIHTEKTQTGTSVVINKMLGGLHGEISKTGWAEFEDASRTHKVLLSCELSPC
jgi:hypothetical protein